MTTHTKKQRADKLKVDKIFEDKDGLAPRLNRLIELTRWIVYLLVTIAMILFALFLRESVASLLELF